jgi:integrase
MVKIDLRGVNCVTNRKTGEVYYYAWRGKGAPRLKGKPGSPEFLASFNEAMAGRRNEDTGRVRALVASYKASSAFTGLADSTRRQWTRWLDRIVHKFGDLRVEQFGRTETIRPIIRRWRDTWADKPRTADYGMQVLSRLLTHAVELDKIRSNPCEGIKTLYRVDRSDVIWTEADLTALRAVARPDVWHGVNLAAHTGLRTGDLRRLAWSHIGDDAIVIPTGKSRGKREAVVPLYDGLRAALEAIPRRSTMVLTGVSGRPMTDGPNGSCFRKALKKAFPDGTELHFHDLRGTAATRFYAAGLKASDIAEILAWDEESVAKILRRYVGQSARMATIIAKLNQTERRT